eukprot:Gb_00719 [translate_table: standard]
MQSILGMEQDWIGLKEHLQERVSKM